MAEIKIEKKTPIWPWILLAVAVIAILILVFSNSDDSVDVEDRRENKTEQRVGEAVDTMKVFPDHTIEFANASFKITDRDSILSFQPKYF